MNTLREQVREAALQFADRLCDLFLSEPAVKLETAVAAARIAGTPLSAPKESASREQIITFVREHPGSAPRDIVRGTGINRGKVFEVLSKACADGVLRKTGSSRLAVYFAGDTATVPAPSPAKASPTSGGRDEDALGRLVSFVREHPGCRGGEIEAAVGVSGGTHRRLLLLAKTSGAIRMTGDRFQARYFPGDARHEADDEVSAGAPSTVNAREHRRADALIEELDDALTSSMSEDRVRIVLEAVVAELRELGEEVPKDDPLGVRIGEAMSQLAAVMSERDLGTLVALDAARTADWEAEAQKARMRLAAFDRAVEDEAVRAERAARSHRERDEAPVEFPILRDVTRTQPLVFVGGIKKNEVLEQARRRYGVDVDWVAAQGGNARAIDAFVDRVRRGRLGAVVVLEGLFGTTQIKEVVNALKVADVPFAYGDKAGTESLRRAFADLEGRLAARQSAES